MIRKRGTKWLVLSKDGRILGEHDTEAAAKAQLRAIEASKHKVKKKARNRGVDHGPVRDDEV